MATIRKIEISHFRGINSLTWCPSEGLNCLIGSGDSGKSTVLNAIELCLGMRRTTSFDDTDFFQLQTDNPLSISITVGDLANSLMNLESYGMFLRAFDKVSGDIEDEPEKELETVLTINLTVASDLNPTWSLVSERSKSQDREQDLRWKDRAVLAPARIGIASDYHLAWNNRSVLNRLSTETEDPTAALASIVRSARQDFGDEAQGDVRKTLEIVAATAKELGLEVGDHVRAMLDTQSVSMAGSAIALHDAEGVPLRRLGAGSSRLLISGLQRKAVEQSSIVVMDEVEHGLEPHRIVRLLDSLGVKEDIPPLQLFMATHSPVAVRELSGDQLFRVLPTKPTHRVVALGRENAVQGTIRKYPEAFLATSVIVCEGASEVGFLRGLDQYRTAHGKDSINAVGTTLVDCHGGHADHAFETAIKFSSLGYRAAILRDADITPTSDAEATFHQYGGRVFCWRSSRTLEDQLFLSLSSCSVQKALAYAVKLHGEDLINQHLKSISKNRLTLSAADAEFDTGTASNDTRHIVAQASRTRHSAWFKTIYAMEAVARDIVGPGLADADAEFRNIVTEIFRWSADAS